MTLIGNPNDNRLRLVELKPIVDIYADGIGAVELLGNCIRVVLYADQGPPDDREHVVVAKIIRQLWSVNSNRLDTMIAQALERARIGAVALH